MNAEKNSALVPALVTLAYLAPQLAPGTPPEGAFSWLCSGMVQSASQALFLFVIIGLSGALPEFGAGRPRSADILRALGLFALLAAAGLGANGLWRATFADPAAKAIMPALESQPWASAALPAAIMGFSLAVGYREELFYRCYAIGSMVRLGARPALAGALSVALFAAGHAYQGAAGALSAGIMGAILTAARLKGAGVHALAWAHAAYDALILFAAYGLLAP